MRISMEIRENPKWSLPWNWKLPRNSRRAIISSESSLVQRLERCLVRFFYEDGLGNAVSVTGKRYRTMINDVLLLQIENLGLENMWFQNDGGPSRAVNPAHCTSSVLNQTFSGRLISCFGNLNWPTTLSKFPVPDFFLQGFLKSRVCASYPTRRQEFITRSFEKSHGICC